MRGYWERLGGALDEGAPLFLGNYFAVRLLNQIRMNEVATYPNERLLRLPLHEYYERSNVALIERNGWVLPKRFLALRDEMRLLENGSALVDFSDHGLLRLEGNDAVDFLNRISTNDFRKFTPGDSVQTVFTTEKGRVIGSVVVLHMKDDILLVTSRGAQGGVKDWIEKFIIAEDLNVTDETGQRLIFVMFHPLEHLDLYPGNIFHSKYFDIDAEFFICDPAADYPDQVRPYMNSQVGYDAFELYKIRRGIPQYDSEVMGECNPLELNLWNQISFSKGCYIGQEVIARLDTYKKVQRSLCSFRAGTLLFPSKECRIVNSGKDIGIVTNCAGSDNDEGTFAGLGLVRKEFALPDAEYSAGIDGVPIIIEHVFDQTETTDGNDINNC